MPTYNPKGFIYVEYADSKRHTDEIIQLEDVSARVKESGQSEQFMSRFLFKDTTGYLIGPVFSPMYFDFDSDDDIPRAQAEAKALVEWMLNAGVDEDYIKIRFTGGKGFSVEIPAAYFGAKPDELLNLYWKEVASMIKRELGLKTLDLSVYDRRRMWRITGTQHAKTGLFKVPLRVKELQNMTIDEIQFIAKAPQLYKLIGDLDPTLLSLPSLYPLKELHYDKSTKKIDAIMRKNKKKFDERVKPDSFDGEKVFSCVKHLLTNGISVEDDGLRREPTGFTIAVALKGLGAPDDYITESLYQFFDNCEPKLDAMRVEREIPNILKQINQTDYASHCQTPCFEQVCKANKLKDTCWVFSEKETEPEIQREEFSETEQQAAAGFLSSSTQIKYIESALEDVVGEERTKMALFLLQLVEESVRMSGETSTGKSYTTDIVLDCFPKHWVKIISGTSDKALRYMPQFVRTIYFKEFAKGTSGAKGDDESTAEYDMKLLMSEGKLTTMLVEKVDGKLTQTEREVVINNFISTSTDVNMSPELRNRQWELATDRTLNMPVVYDALEQVAMPKGARRDHSGERKVLRYAIEVLDQECAKRYIIPYAPLLAPIFEPLKHNARIRRDVRKLLKLIYASAKLHYKNRPTTEDGEIICLPEDFVVAWTYGEDALMGTFTEMTKRMKEVWAAVVEMHKLNKKITAPAVGTVANISRQKAGDWLRRFTNENLLQVKERNSSGVVYVFTGTESAGNTEVTIDMNDLNELTSRVIKRLNVPMPRLKALPDVVVSIPVLNRVNVEDLEDAEGGAPGGGTLGAEMNPWQLQMLAVLMKEELLQ